MSLWLAKDQRSNAVVALQNALNLRLKRPKPLVLDGIFGPHTEAAVQDFQKCEGLKADGIAGPKTLGALFVRRTVVNRFYVKVASPPPLPTMPAFAQGAAPLVGSPYDLPHLPHREMPSYEQQVRAWLAHPTPKPELPARPQAPELSSLRRRRGPRLLGKRPRAFGSPNEWAEFEFETEFGYQPGGELEITQLFTAAFVKAAPFVIPSASFFVKPGGLGVRGSVQFLDTPFFEREWNEAAPEPGTVKLSIAPSLVTSVLWDYGQRYPRLDIFGGMQIAARWTKELHNRHGRALSLAMSAGLAVGAVTIGEKETEGRFQMHPFGFQGTFNIGGSLGIGRRRRRH